MKYLLSLSSIKFRHPMQEKKVAIFLICRNSEKHIPIFMEAVRQASALLSLEKSFYLITLNFESETLQKLFRTVPFFSELNVNIINVSSDLQLKELVMNLLAINERTCTEVIYFDNLDFDFAKLNELIEAYWFMEEQYSKKQKTVTVLKKISPYNTKFNVVCLSRVYKNAFMAFGGSLIDKIRTTLRTKLIWMFVGVYFQETQFKAIMSKAAFLYLLNGIYENSLESLELVLRMQFMNFRIRSVLSGSFRKHYSNLFKDFKIITKMFFECYDGF